MGSFKDITGQRFGNLLVLSKTKQRDINSSVVWKCLCDCGNITYSNSSNLKRGHTTSCGCNKQKYIDLGLYSELSEEEKAALRERFNKNVNNK